MEVKPSRFEIRLPSELQEQIDQWRRQQPDLPPRAEAARRLIEAGLRPGLTTSETRTATVIVSNGVLDRPIQHLRTDMPWHKPTIRPGAVKDKNVRLPEDLLAQIAWLKAETEINEKDIITNALRSYLRSELITRGASPDPADLAGSAEGVRKK